MSVNAETNQQKESAESVYQKHMAVSEEQRKSKSAHYLKKYPDLIPVFITNSLDSVSLNCQKVLLKKNFTVA